MLPDDPASQARLFYLLALLMVVAFWFVVHFRNQLGRALQQALIWVLIFLGVVLAAGFAEPLRQTLFHDVARPVAPGSVVLERARDGHFYATAQVNGQTILFLIDTGATQIVLSRRDAERAGIDTRSLSYVIPVSTANGVVSAAPVVLESVLLGSFSDGEVQATVIDTELGQSLLGMDYLNRFDNVRLEGDRFYLTR